MAVQVMLQTLVYFLVLISLVVIAHGETEHVKFFMPFVRPTKKDTYFCTGLKVDESQPHFITAFEPHRYEGITHHMLLFGCTEPGSDADVWNCGEMGGYSGKYSAPPCASGTQIMYAWAHSATSLALPEGVGFKVGGDTDVQYLVLQVHYADLSKLSNQDIEDDSGIIITATTEPTPKLAGVLIMGTGGLIRPHSVEHFETECPIEDDVEMHPFAFRTHTHASGKVVAGYRVRDGEWSLIGKHNPQEPQMFYPVSNTDLVIRQNDYVAARCTMDNENDREIHVGPGMDDEMCNFYVMYWVDDGNLLHRKNCFTAGPPFHYWKMDRYMGPVPSETDREASIVGNE